MNKLSIEVKSILTFLVLLSTAVIAPVSWAHDDCTPYTSVLHMEGPSPFGPLNGIGTYNIGDQPPQLAQISSVLKGSGSFDPASSVVEISFASMALFAPDADGGLNALSGVDRVIGTVTGPGMFESDASSRITGGVGLYENVKGKVRSKSTSSVDPTTGYTVVDINARGNICGIGKAGND